MKTRDCLHHGTMQKHGKPRSLWLPGEPFLFSIIMDSSSDSPQLQTGWEVEIMMDGSGFCWQWPTLWSRLLTWTWRKIIFIDHHCRFLAKEFGFAGKDNAEQAQADEMVDVIVDLIDEQVFIFVSRFSSHHYNHLSCFRSGFTLERTKRERRSTRRSGFQLFWQRWD